MLMTILILIFVAIAALVAYAATRPDTFKIERTTHIAAPPAKVFPLIADLKGFNTWNPFAKSDPTTRIEYQGAESGIGSAYSWVGKKSGEGTMEVTNLTAPTSVAMDLRFTKPMAANNKVLFTLRDVGGGTDVSWVMSGTMGFAHKLFGLVFNMDKMVGGEFAKGLADLKTIAER